MSYLAQMLIDKKNAAKKNLFSLYDWHCLAWKLFPDKKKEDKRDFLTRIDTAEKGFYLTVLSAMEPEKPDWCTTDCWKQKFLPESFFQSKRYLFKILTNPTKTLSHRDPGGNKKKNGSHFGITRKEELRKWFIQKGEQNGYHVLDEPELEIAPPVFYKLNRKNDAGVLVGVEFKGGLEVISIEKFASAVRKGIGRARGFGFGMFVIKPIL